MAEPQEQEGKPSLLAICIALGLLCLSIYYRFLRHPPTPKVRKGKERMKMAEAAAAVEPVQVGDVTAFELEAYDGRDPSKPLLMAIKGNIYDVTRGSTFYGPPDGPYCAFAGRDASRALAKMSFKPEDINGSLEGLTYAETDVLNDWEAKFEGKYPKVGRIVANNAAAN